MNPTAKHLTAPDGLMSDRRHASSQSPGSISTSETHASADVIEARLAARLALAVTLASHELQPDIAERLRFAREKALQRAALSRHTAASAQMAQPRLGLIGPVLPGLGQAQPWWQRLVPLLPLVVLVAGLFVIDRQVEQEEVRAVADFDSLLLADTLPPAAYSDPGFAEFLRTAPPQ